MILTIKFRRNGFRLDKNFQTSLPLRQGWTYAAVLCNNIIRILSFFVNFGPWAANLKDQVIHSKFKQPTMLAVYMGFFQLPSMKLDADNRTYLSWSRITQVGVIMMAQGNFRWDEYVQFWCFIFHSIICTSYECYICKLSSNLYT